MAANIIDLSAFPAAEETNIKTIHRETYLSAWQLKDCKAIMNVTTDELAKKQFCEGFGFGLGRKSFIQQDSPSCMNNKQYVVQTTWIKDQVKPEL